MPNYIKNRIEIIGTDEAIKACVERFTTHFERIPTESYDGRLTYQNNTTNNYGWLDLKTNEFTERNKTPINGVPEGFEQCFVEAWDRLPDFNKIIPMPEGLDISIHSGVENAVKSTLKMPYSDNPLLASLEKSSRNNSKNPLDFDDNDWELYIQALNNVKKHGYLYWYDWAIDNWGTKWNTSECEEFKKNIFDFQTAWSGVPHLILEMSKICPDVVIHYKWSDEDTGSNCGNIIFKNGILEETDIENGSIEAYEIAFELRPENKKYYNLVDGEYAYIDEDEYEED